MQLTDEQKEQNVAALRALMDGKSIEYFYEGVWLDTVNVDACEVYPHRPKPAPVWTLPAPPDGKRWHRNDWTADMLPDGWRPLLDGEIPKAGDELDHYTHDHTWWTEFEKDSDRTCNYGCPYFHRTRRPLPSEPVTRPWASPDDVPVGKIARHKGSGWRYLIIGAGVKFVRLPSNELHPEKMLSDYTMDDGSPCGVTENT